MNVGRESGGIGVTLGETVVNLKNNMDILGSAVTAVNSSLVSHVNESVVYKKKLEVTILSSLLLRYCGLSTNCFGHDKMLQAQ